MKTRNRFSPAEDEHLVIFLSTYASFARTSISTYRSLCSQPWGSKHTPESWLQRYKRQRRTYDSRIDNYLEELVVGDTMSTEGSPRIERQQAFQDLPIPFTTFKARPSPISETDQYIAFNLAVNHLVAIHGLDAAIVYETWKLTGDLHLTDIHLRQTMLSIVSGVSETMDVDDDDEGSTGVSSSDAGSRSRSPQHRQSSPGSDCQPSPLPGAYESESDAESTGESANEAVISAALLDRASNSPSPVPSAPKRLRARSSYDMVVPETQEDEDNHEEYVGVGADIHAVAAAPSHHQPDTGSVNSEVKSASSYGFVSRKERIIHNTEFDRRVLGAAGTQDDSQSVGDSYIATQRSLFG